MDLSQLLTLTAAVLLVVGASLSIGFRFVIQRYGHTAADHALQVGLLFEILTIPAGLASNVPAGIYAAAVAAIVLVWSALTYVLFLRACKRMRPPSEPHAPEHCASKLVEGIKGKYSDKIKKKMLSGLIESPQLSYEFYCVPTNSSLYESAWAASAVWCVLYWDQNVAQARYAIEDTLCRNRWTVSDETNQCMGAALA